MSYTLYKCTSPSGRTYIGITNDFKRRLKEHGSSQYAFGHALRKYGKHNFTYEFEEFDSLEEALLREAELVNPETIASRKLYNETVGGVLSNVLSLDNPMHREGVAENHPNLWSTENNPMNNPESRQKMIESQARKPVSIDGVRYEGVREAARQIGISRQLVVYRLRARSFETWYYL